MSVHEDTISKSDQAVGAEPVGRPRRGRSTGLRALGLLEQYGLLAVLIALVVVFSVTLSATFPTTFTFRSLLETQSVVALVSLAVMLPLIVGHFDLSVGYVITITDVLVVGLQINQHVPWEAAIGIGLAVSLVIGLCNGFLVTVIGINAFIATLASGTVLYGLAEWYSGGSQIAGNLSNGFIVLTNTIGPIPAPAIYVIVVAVLLWLLTEHMPSGRIMYVTGANPRAAQLVGIRTRRVIWSAFVASSVLSCVAGIVLASELAVGNSEVGPEYLLQAYAAAFLGATSIRPGRFNVWGTVIAVLILAVAVEGLQQMGASFYVESLFDGGILLVAVALSVYASRRAKTEDDNEVEGSG
jgi:ribose transport system permease protein